MRPFRLLEPLVPFLERALSEKPPVVKKEDLALLEEQLKEIESFLTLKQGEKGKKGENQKEREWEKKKENQKEREKREKREKREELASKVEACFTAWQELMSKQQENEWAKSVLAAYERQGKIRDLLAKARSYADGMESIGDAEMAREMGYSNHFFYLRHYISELPDRPASSQRSMTLMADSVATFIQTECGSVACLSGLPNARKTAQELLIQMQVGQPKTELDEKRLEEIQSTLDSLSSYSKEELLELKDIRSSIVGRTDAMKENIHRGSALFKALTDIMTDAWFDDLDPQTENRPINSMALPELQALYKNKLAEVESKLEGIV